MYDPLQFYRGYLVDYFVYKTAMLKNIIDNYDELRDAILDGITDIDGSDFLKSIRADLRSTYFQAIETLFELIFALEPVDGRFVDKDIWLRLSTSNFRRNFRRIGEIAEGKTDFLDEEVGWLNYSDGEKRRITLVEYIFFYSSSTQEIEEQILNSLPAIRKALVLFAQEFSDRDEYNAMKHGLRIFPVLKQFAMGPSSTGEFPFKLDMSKSWTYLKRESDESISLYTNPLDSERDASMTYLCASLIQNIVTTRRVKLAGDEKEEKRISVPTLEQVEELSNSNVNWGTFRFNIKPIYADDVEGTDVQEE